VRSLMFDGVGYDESFHQAVTLLENKPAKGGYASMVKSYKRIERTLPPHWQREKTHRRHKPPLG
jgi:hypothetical protein